MLVLSIGCAPRTTELGVGVVFTSNWRLGPVTLSDAEVTTVKTNAVRTLERAFRGYNVRFTEDASRDHLVQIDRGGFFAAGATATGSRASRVSLDGTYLSLLSVAGCSGLASCPTRSRAELVEALGRGLGATAAHELGHQAGFRFVRDSACDDCYDGAKSATYAHFFGEKHWSPNALRIMNRVLPTRATESSHATDATHQTHATQQTHATD